MPAGSNTSTPSSRPALRAQWQATLADAGRAAAPPLRVAREEIVELATRAETANVANGAGTEADEQKRSALWDDVFFAGLAAGGFVHAAASDAQGKAKEKPAARADLDRLDEALDARRFRRWDRLLGAFAGRQRAKAQQPPRVER